MLNVTLKSWGTSPLTVSSFVEDEQKSYGFWNDMNFHFWDNYPFRFKTTFKETELQNQLILKSLGFWPNVKSVLSQTG